MRYTNRAIAKAFAAGARTGRTGRGTMFIDGDAIYSYGYHWPIAVRRPGKQALVNRDRYSRTTSKQTGYVAGELALAGWEVKGAGLADLEKLGRARA